MATPIISQASASDIPSLSIEAYGISSLMLWISEARQLIEDVRACAKRDTSLKHLLERNDVRFNSAEWEDETATGMEILLVNHRVTVRNIMHAAERGTL
ncbi:hypothetical protein J2W27_000033 [Variovorax boronicumulans]|uniref:hypothetical protein n=1 Tax=Variovorax boronicumulans TaxID=436515 RepID=UPI002782ECEF|nr:hypothetical protein [Variovorax boronicumulans]MDP9907940.1 hypothetical protein [Variovorax boronicumulans]